MASGVAGIELRIRSTFPLPKKPYEGTQREEKKLFLQGVFDIVFFCVSPMKGFQTKPTYQVGSEGEGKEVDFLSSLDCPIGSRALLTPWLLLT